METQIATIGLILLESKKYVIIEEIKIVKKLPNQKHQGQTVSDETPANLQRLGNLNALQIIPEYLKEENILVPFFFSIRKTLTPKLDQNQYNSNNNNKKPYRLI